MIKKIFNFLSESGLTQPKDVDRLIVSAFVVVNRLSVIKNEFLKDFLIDEEKHTEYLKLSEFVDIVNKEWNEFKIEDLIELFEFVVSPEDRIINGAIYTPLNIRDYIVRQSFSERKHLIQNSRVADISCGCGGFLYNAAKEFKRYTKKTYSEIFKKHIFGLDIQSYSITRAKILLIILAVTEGEDRKEFQFNLFVGDALDFKWGNVVHKFSGFDFVFGNPPYVCSRHLTAETKDKLNNWKVCKSGHPDLYIPFFQIGVECLSTQGVLGFITMNSFFKSLNGRGLREYFQSNSLAFRIIDFGTKQIFKSRYTYTCICFIENKKDDSIKYYKPNEIKKLPKSKKQFCDISYKKLDSKKGWNLQNHEIVSKIEATGTPLGELFKTRSGIATLRNDIYIFNPIQEDNDFYYLQNGSVYQIEKGICRDILNSNKLNESSLFSTVKEKVIFPYENTPKPKLLQESYIKKNFPKAYKYLEAKREILRQRDNGAGDYENWFAFGRTQSLEKIKHKLFFPHFAAKTPKYLINSDENLLFYNGLALMGRSRSELMVVKKVMESKIFWYYIQNTSKPYTSGYYSFRNNYIRNFGICSLDKRETEFVLNENDQNTLDNFFVKKYGIKVV
jgi:type I restriction-modification system DNA methylase subunit